MNDFQSINSGSGLLKDTYGDTGLSDALNKKRKKLAEGRGIEVKEESTDDSDQKD